MAMKSSSAIWLLGMRMTSSSSSASFCSFSSSRVTTMGGALVGARHVVPAAAAAAMVVGETEQGGEGFLAVPAADLRGGGRAWV